MGIVKKKKLTALLHVTALTRFHDFSLNICINSSYKCIIEVEDLTSRVAEEAGANNIEEDYGTHDLEMELPITNLDLPVVLITKKKSKDLKKRKKLPFIYRS